MFKCIECKRKGDFCFFKNLENGLEYNYCDHCGISWKSINGKFMKGSKTTKLFDKKWMGFDVDDMIATATYKDHIQIGGILASCKKYISDYYCRCLRCNRIISTTLNESGCYECKHCGFEWGVVNVE